MTRGWPVWAWLLLALAALLAAGAVVFAIVVAGGGEDAAVVKYPVVNRHTAEVHEPALLPVPGYAYEDVTADERASVWRPISAANQESRQMFPELGVLYLDWSCHTVRAADSEVAVLVLATLNQEYLDAGIINEQNVLLAWASGPAGAARQLITETIAGEEVLREDAGVTSYNWIHGGVVTRVYGARDFVEDYLATAHQA